MNPTDGDAKGWRMQQAMVQSSREVAEAVGQLMAYLNEDAANNPEPYRPHDLIMRVSDGRNVGAFLAAFQSLLSTGEIEQTPGWKVRLRTANV